MAGEINFAAPADLPDARDARFDREPPAMGWRIFCHFARDRRPWPYQGHIANQDIVELRQFIQRELAQPFADLGNAGIIFELESNVFVSHIAFTGAASTAVDWRSLSFNNSAGPQILAVGELLR